jgi:SpoVK/Ycf46/Vps4 family AAA+-type ATPase
MEGGVAVVMKSTRTDDVGAMLHDRKELLARLGLPHKLSVLLHGSPGTGKTTTIAAIATFLGATSARHRPTNAELCMPRMLCGRRLQARERSKWS